MASKSAFEEAFGFLSKKLQGTKSAISSSVSSFSSDFSSWKKKQEEEERKRREKTKRFLSDAKDYFNPEKAASGRNLWTAPATKSLVRTRPIQDISRTRNALTRNVQDFSNLIKSRRAPGPPVDYKDVAKYSATYNPLTPFVNKTARDLTPQRPGGGFWTTPASNTLVKTQLGMQSVPGLLKNVGFPQVGALGQLMSSAMLDFTANKLREEGKSPSPIGIFNPSMGLTTAIKDVLPVEWKENVASFLEDKADPLKERGLQDFVEAEEYIKNNPTSVDMENMTLLEKMKEPEWWAQSIAVNGPNTIASAGASMSVGVATGNPFLAVATAYGASFMLEGGGLYYDALQNGMSEEEALEVTMIGAPIIAMFDFLVPGEWGETMAMRQSLKKLAITDFIALMMKTTGIEVGTESTQEFILNVLAKYGIPWKGIQGYDPNRPLFANVAEAGVQSFPMAIGGTTVTTVLSGRQGNVDITEEPVSSEILAPSFRETIDPLIEKYGLSDFPAEEYSTFKISMSNDKKTGYSIKPDGDLISVFNTGEKGNGAYAVIDAIENGAVKLDAFDGNLIRYYEQFGFEEYKREANWTPGEPDVVYMRLNPEKYGQFKRENPTYYEPEAGPVFERNFQPLGQGPQGPEGGDVQIAPTPPEGQVEEPQYRIEETGDPATGVGQTITTDTGQKAMIWNADWLGVNAAGEQTPMGLRYIEGQSTWAIRPAAATWVQNQMAQGVDDIIIVANASPAGLKTNPEFHSFVFNDIAKTLGEDGEVIVAKAKEANPDSGFKAISAAIQEAKKDERSVLKSLTAYYAKASESEGLVNAYEPTYVAKVIDLKLDNEHPSYPVKVYLSNVRQFTEKIAIRDVFPEMGSKELSGRMRGRFTAETETTPLGEMMGTAVPLNELAVARDVGVTPATTSQAFVGTPAFDLTAQYVQLWDAGDYAGANAVKQQLLTQGQAEFEEIFADNPEIEINVSFGNATYFGDSEPTLVINATMPKTSEGVFIRKIGQVADTWGQRTVHVSEVVPTLSKKNQPFYGKEFADGFVFEPNYDIRLGQPLTDAEVKIVADEIQKLGLAGSTFHSDNAGLMLYNISKFKPYGQFIKEVSQIQEALGGLYRSGHLSGGEEAWAQIETFRSTRRLLVGGLEEDGATRSYDQLGSYVSPTEKGSYRIAIEEAPYNLSIEQVENKLSQFFNDDEVAFIASDPGAIVTENGQIAVGKYTSALIQAVERDGKVQDITVYHEAFHAYEDMFADPKLKKQARAQIKKELSLKDDVAAGEALAEGFTQWLPTRTGVTGKIKVYFEWLFNNLKGLVGRKNQVEAIYQEMLAKKRAKGIKAGQIALSYRDAKGVSVNGVYQPNLTAKIIQTLINEVKGGETGVTSLQHIENLTNRGGLKQVERDMAREVANRLAVDGKVNVGEFIKEYQKNLLPLQAGKETAWENVVLSEEVRGDVNQYFERVYSSPFATGPGRHFGNFPNYFAHVRLEDMADFEVIPLSEYTKAKIEVTNVKASDGTTVWQVLRDGKIFYEGTDPVAAVDMADRAKSTRVETGGTRRIIEIQSDLFQISTAMFERQFVPPKAINELLFEVEGLRADKPIKDIKALAKNVKGLIRRTGLDKRNNVRIRELIDEIDKRITWRNDTAPRIGQAEANTKQVAILEETKNLYSSILRALPAPPKEALMKRRLISPYKNFWFERILKEEINKAAMDGKGKLQVPTGETIAKIEGYVGTGIVSEHAEIGDTFEYGNFDFLIIEDMGNNVMAVNLEDIEKEITFEEAVKEEVDKEMIDRVIDEFNRLSEDSVIDPSLDTMIKRAIPNVKGINDYKASPVSYIKENRNDLELRLREEIEGEIREKFPTPRDYVDYWAEKTGLGHAAMGDEIMVLREGTYPEELSRGVEEFDVEALSSDQRTIVNRYEKDYPRYLRKLRPDLKKVTDGNGISWWETKITPKDKAAVEAFRVEDKKKAPKVPEKVESTEDFWMAMDALRKFRGYKVDSYKTPVIPEEDLGMEALAKYRGYSPISPEVVEQITPEAMERINNLNDTRAEFMKQIGDVEDVVKNYDFYTKRFGKLMYKKELASLKKELKSLVKDIDGEITELQKQTVDIEKPAPTNEELAMQALEESRKPIQEVVEEVVQEKATPPEDVMETKEKFGKDIQEQIDKETTKVVNKDGEPMEIDTGRGAIGRLINGTKGWNKDMSNRFATWANASSKANVAEIRVKGMFSKYDSEGMDGILSIQRGEEKHKDVNEYFDVSHTELNEGGVPVGYWENYMPGVWENSKKELDKMYSRKVYKSPDFSMNKIFNDYQEGVDAGFSPKYETISQLAGYYERKKVIALENKKFFSYLMANKYILPDSKAPPSWKNLNSQAFFKYETRTDEGTYRGMYKASPELADAINTILGAPTPVLAIPARIVSIIKGIILSSGIPGTGITFHTFNVLSRYVHSANNPVAKALKGGWWALRPNEALKTIKANESMFEEFVGGGMTGSSEDQGISTEARKVQGNLVKKGVIRMKNWQERMFEQNIFQKIIPAMKLDFAMDTHQRLVKKGIEHKEAVRQAAALANEQFGGINIEQIARNKDFQNLLRVTFLASDWMETNVRLGTGLVRNVVPGQRSQLTEGQKMVYTRMTRNLVLLYVVYNVFNKMLSDKWLWENDKGNEFNIDTGLYSSNGQKIYFRPYGTSADYIRLPYEIARAAMSGDFSVAAKTVRNRLSPLLSVGMGVLTDRDYAGRAIGYKGIDQYGSPMSPTQRVGGIANELMSLGFPSFVRSPIDYATGRVSLEEAITRTAELPVRYSGGAYTEAQKKQKDLIKLSGGTSEDVYKHFQEKREKSKLKREAAKVFKEEGKTGLDRFINKLFNRGPEPDRRIELIKIQYDFDEVAEKEAITVVEKAKLEKEKLTLAKNIWNNSKEIPEMTIEERSILVEELGFKPEEIEYYSIASEQNSVKFSYTEDLLSRTESEDRMATLAALRYKVGDKMILADGVIDDLYEYGYITKEEKKYLKAIMWDEKEGTFRTERAAAASAAKPKKVSLKIPSYKTPKPSRIKLPNVDLSPIKTAALMSNVPKAPSSISGVGVSRAPVPTRLALPSARMPDVISQLGR